MDAFQTRVLDKLDKIESDVVQVKLDIAALPHKYVPRNEVEQVRQETIKTRRWIVTTGIGAVAVLVPVILTSF